MAPQKFKPRDRKQRARPPKQNDNSNTDSNAREMLPDSKSQRETRRTLLMEQAKAAQSPSKASSKKNKRLEKYIDNKLKKEENLDIIKKLSNQYFDTSLLSSSKRLGQQTETQRDILRRTLKERRAGITSNDAEDVLFTQYQPPSTKPNTIPDKNSTEVAFGSGLKRPMVTSGSIPKRQKRRKISLENSNYVERPEFQEWNGFSTDPSSLENSTEDESGHGPQNTTSDESGSESAPDPLSEDEGNGNIDSRSANLKNSRSSAFKQWALLQRNTAMGFKPSAIDEPPSETPTAGDTPAYTSKNIPIYVNRVINPILKDQVKVDAGSKPYVIHVKRSPEIQEVRNALPIIADEHKLVEAIRSHDCVVVTGSTGSGKTTQVPQFLFEAGFGSRDTPHPGMIGVTQPRRVAAINMAKRVSLELGEHGHKVAHQVRFESSIRSDTSIKFMTDGILLREISKDFLLSKYSAIVIDEAHERSVNSDLLIGLLTRIVTSRRKLADRTPTLNHTLKLIIMSATLMTEAIAQNTHLFPRITPPILEVEGRQYTVTTHFARRTEPDFVQEMFEKVKRGHKKLPDGGMLVFMTGQDDISQLSKKLKTELPATDSRFEPHSIVRVSAEVFPLEEGDIDPLGMVEDHDDYDDDSDTKIRGVDNEGSVGLDEFDVASSENQPASSKPLKIHILPLYSQLPPDRQQLVFEPPPSNSRLIVLCTNVAETSLTIPGIRYVFDCGRAKEKIYDRRTSVQSFRVNWISKASAQQRAGRAGRTSPGHCYRLYSSAVYERDFPASTQPEILRIPADGVVLQLKGIGIPNVLKFPFPTPPPAESLLQAERTLQYLGAVADDCLTLIGKELSYFPLPPRLARMLVVAISQERNVLEHAIALIAALGSPQLFKAEAHVFSDQDGSDGEEATSSKRKAYNTFHAQCSRLDRHSDALKYLTLLRDYSGLPAPQSAAASDFQSHAIVKNIKEALQLRTQITSIISNQKPGLLPSDSTSVLPDPPKKRIQLLRQIVASGYPDQIAIRADMSPTPPALELPRPKKVADVPYITLFPSSSRDSVPQVFDSEASLSAAEKAKLFAHRNYAYIHPSSLLCRTTAVTNLPQYLVYSHLSHGNVPADGVPRTRLHPLVPVSAQTLVVLAEGTPLLRYGNPVGKKIDALDRDENRRERRRVWSVPFLTSGDVASDGIGNRNWPLAEQARERIEVRVPGKGWIGEQELREK